MRLLVDTVIALMLAAMLGGALLSQRQDREQLDRIAAVQQSVRAIQSQALYRAAMGEVEATPSGYSRKIDIAWFDGPPRNILVEDEGEAFQWIDYPAEDAHQAFDPTHIVASGGQASFWYNPFRGIVRARVPRQFTQQATVDLYNLVNGTSLRVADCRWDYREGPRVVSRDDPEKPVAATPASDSTPSRLAQKKQ